MSSTSEPTPSTKSTFTRSDLNAPAWLEIPSLDVPRTRTFYQTVFNWDFRPATESYPSDAFAMFTHRNPPLMGAIRKVSESEHRPGCGGMTVFLMVEDVDKTLAEVVRAGGKIVQGKFVEGGHTELARYSDTEGNVGGILRWLM